MSSSCGASEIATVEGSESTEEYFTRVSCRSMSVSLCSLGGTDVSAPPLFFFQIESILKSCACMVRCVSSFASVPANSSTVSSASCGTQCSFPNPTPSAQAQTSSR